MGTLDRGIQSAVKGVGVLMGIALVTLFGVSLVLAIISHANADFLWSSSVVLALLGVIMIASTMKKYIWGMVGPVVAVWLFYVIVLIPLITEGPNLRTQVSKLGDLGRPCAFLNMDDAKIIFYLDKPYQFFYDEAHALDWATRADGVLIASGNVSDQSWDCAVRGHRWQAVTPRKGSLLKDFGNSR